MFKEMYEHHGRGVRDDPTPGNSNGRIPSTANVSVDRISSAVPRGVSHEGRLIDKEACNQEQEDNRDTRVRQVQAVSMT